MRTSTAVRFDVVIPTIGRQSLARLLEALTVDDGPRPGRIVVVDDRSAGAALEVPAGVDVLRSGGRGPAGARNDGWRRTSAPWVCFLDDDVVTRRGWSRALLTDLEAADERVGAIQGRVRVPLPPGRQPTDSERSVAMLEGARWITADMAVRRQALASVGGFDERFPRAYREDSDLALRLVDAGWCLSVGTRTVDHPVRPSHWTASVRAQRGNADDALMARLHGTDWRRRAEAPRGTQRQHVLTTIAAGTALAASIAGARPLAAVAFAGWLTQAIRFWWHRAAPGPRHAGELAGLAASSVFIAPAATAWAVAGRLRARRLAPEGPADRWAPTRPAMVLFDRDGTLVVDVPYNGDPNLVRPVPGAGAALHRLRDAGIVVGMISNQSGVARGLLHIDQVEAVNRHVECLLGPFAVIEICVHGPDDGCECRKPAPGMILAAVRRLGIEPARCAVVGDIGSDVDAAVAAGARGILVPNSRTLEAEIRSAPEIAADLMGAVETLLSGEPATALRQREEVVT